MGHAKRRKQAQQSGKPWPRDEWGDIKLKLWYMPDDGMDRDVVTPTSSGAGVRPDQTWVLSAFDAQRSDGSRLAVVIGLGEGGKVSPIAHAALNRAMRRYPEFPEIHMVQMSDMDTAPACVAWNAIENEDTIGRILFFACPDPKMVDRVSCPLLYDRSDVAVFMNGERLTITQEERQRSRETAARVYRDWYGESREDQFTAVAQTVTTDWVFELNVDGIHRRTMVFNGLWKWDRAPEASDYRRVGGNNLHIAQINDIVGGTRSAIRAAKVLFKSGADGVVLWARNKEIYNSIVSEFVAAECPTASDGVELPDDWKPRIFILPCRG